MTGKRHGFHAQWRVGFDDDGRLQALDATLTSDGGWSLDLSEPVLARALCHVDNAYWIPHVRVHGRVAQTHKTSQTAFRGFGGPQGMLVIEDILGRCAPAARDRPDRPAPPQLLRRRARPRPTASRCATPSGPAPRGTRCSPAGDVARRRAEIAAFNAAPPAHQARPGDDAGEVRHLLQLHRLQPGRRAGARLQGRLGADQPRRHRDGPGPAHQDAAGRGDHPRRAARAGPPRARPAPTRCPTPPPPRPAPAPTSTAARSRTPASRSLARLREVDAGRGLAWEELVREAYFSRVQLWAAGFYRTEGLHWDSTRDARATRSSTSPTASPRPRSRSTASPAPTGPGGSTSCTTSATACRRWSTSARSRAASCRASGWLTLEDLRWDESDGPGRGRLTTQSASTYKLPELRRAARRAQRRAARARARGRRGLRLQGRRRAAADAGVLGARGAARGGRGVRPGRAPASTSPRRPRPRRSSGRSSRPGVRRRHDHVVEGLPGVVPDQPDADAEPLHPRSEQAARRRGGRDCTGWPRSSGCARSGWPACWSRVADVRGHAPRDAGAKMVVAADGVVGERRRRQPRGDRRRPGAGDARRGAAGARAADRRPHRQGAAPSTAGSAAAARSPCCSSRCPSCRPSRSSASATSGSSWPGSSPATTSTCTSSTPAPTSSTDERLALPRRRPRRGSTSTTRRSPSWRSARCRAGTHVLVMTHDHAEDFALCDAALRCAHLGSIGLIGSAAKWARFRTGLAVEGHDEATIARIRCPIGAARPRRQGAGHHRRRRSPPTWCRVVRRRPRPGRSMTAREVVYRARAFDTPDDPFAGRRRLPLRRRPRARRRPTTA